MKIWTKIIKGEKILKDNIYAPQNFDMSKITEYLEEICNKLDEPTPIILSKHLYHLNIFSNTHFKPEDFVESVNFDKMVIEIFEDQKKKQSKKM